MRLLLAGTFLAALIGHADVLDARDLHDDGCT